MCTHGTAAADAGPGRSPINLIQDLIALRGDGNSVVVMLAARHAYAMKLVLQELSYNACPSTMEGEEVVKDGSSRKTVVPVGAKKTPATLDSKVKHMFEKCKYNFKKLPLRRSQK